MINPSNPPNTPPPHPKWTRPDPEPKSYYVQNNAFLHLFLRPEREQTPWIHEWRPDPTNSCPTYLSDCRARKIWHTRPGVCCHYCTTITSFVFYYLKLSLYQSLTAFLRSWFTPRTHTYISEQHFETCFDLDLSSAWLDVHQAPGAFPERDSWVDLNHFAGRLKTTLSAAIPLLSSHNPITCGYVKCECGGSGNSPQDGAFWRWILFRDLARTRWAKLHTGKRPGPETKRWKETGMNDERISSKGDRKVYSLTDCNQSLDICHIRRTKAEESPGTSCV